MSTFLKNTLEKFFELENEHVFTTDQMLRMSFFKMPFFNYIKSTWIGGGELTPLVSATTSYHVDPITL